MSRKTIGVTVLAVLIIALGIGAYAVAHNGNGSGSTGTTSGTSSTYLTSPSNTKTQPAQQSTEQKIGSILVVKTDASLGKYLATPSGQPLYTYGADSASTSNCSGSCLTEWPAYQDTGATTDLPANVSTIQRTDNGQTQFTYKGMPLYTFVDDTAGKITGNNVDNFQIAKP